MHLDFPAIFSAETRSLALLLPPMYTHSSREVDKVVLAEEKKLAPDNSNCNLGETKQNSNHTVVERGKDGVDKPSQCV